MPTAAKVLGIGRNLAYEACANGQLPSIRLGHRLIIPVEGQRRLIQDAEGNGGGR